MNNNNIFDVLQQSFRLTIGATTVFLETLQDSQKRQEAFSQLQTQWSELAQEWEQKGEKTEAEARKMMDNFWGKKWDFSPKNESNQAVSTTVDVSATTSNSSTTDNHNSEVQNLTQQIVELRQELEEIRHQS
jgi:polyhydroxyalkanoate synthesis regulator phasin